MPDFEGWPFHAQVIEVKFEAAAYVLLRSEPSILASRLLYHRIPVQYVGPRRDLPQDIAGRRLFLFERAEGENQVWWTLGPEEKVCANVRHLLYSFRTSCANLLQVCLLTQSARIRASLFNFNLPIDFATVWLRERLFEQRPETIPVPVAPTREFCVALFTSKIEATIRNLGDMIGWESDNVTVGPVAVAAKQSLLRIIPHIMPVNGDQTSLYRLVLEHGDFGIHNMSITMDANSQPLVTSLYDWETGCIVPALLSDPLMAVAVDLVIDEYAIPSITRVSDDATPDERSQYMKWARHYVEVRPSIKYFFLCA